MSPLDVRGAPIGVFGEDVAAFMSDAQRTLCETLQSLDGGADFIFDAWQRPGGGGGLTGILNEGALFERAGVNSSAVWGALDKRMLERLGTGAPQFFATGVSLVLHPRSPMVPTVHANVRYLERGPDAWFGGGSDLTPYYPYEEDAVGFHQAWKSVCDRHDRSYYPKFKRWCDEYFYLPHRAEPRGIGGIFFDELRGDLDAAFAFVRDCAANVIPAYRPIVDRRRDEPFGPRERRFQALRRGRYVEFNLVYDRGTAFGLATGGRAEAILMSLPPAARWEYDWQPEPHSREARALELLRPRDWLAGSQTSASEPLST